MLKPPYKNRVWLQGRVTSHPSVKSLSPRTKLTAFQLSMVEGWENASGESKERKNRIAIEVVGKDSARVAAELRIGSWVTLEGYIRSENFKGREFIKVRTLTIDVWHDKLAERFSAAELETEGQRLPGWRDLLEKNNKASKAIAERRERIELALRDEDEVLFLRALGEWDAAWCRVNEILAEEYRQSNPDSKTWELRYFKWMKKVKFIRFDSPLGEFYLVPREPGSLPSGALWYTADEMIAMIKPSVAAAITAFKKLPVRAETLSRPGKGENHMHIDFTGSEPVVKYELWKGGRFGRESIR